MNFHDLQNMRLRLSKIAGDALRQATQLQLPLEPPLEPDGLGPADALRTDALVALDLAHRLAREVRGLVEALIVERGGVLEADAPSL